MMKPTLKKKNGTLVKAFSPEAKLKRRIRAHFTKLGFARADDGALVLPGTAKQDIRQLHSGQRAERLRFSENFLLHALPKTLPHFADGAEIDPSNPDYSWEPLACGQMAASGCDFPWRRRRAERSLGLRRGVCPGAHRPIGYGGSLAMRPARSAKPT
jgi:hypothetical protein